MTKQELIDLIREATQEAGAVVFEPVGDDAPELVIQTMGPDDWEAWAIRLEATDPY